MKPLRRNDSRDLRIEKLEPRHLLASVAGPICPSGVAETGLEAPFHVSSGHAESVTGMQDFRQRLAELTDTVQVGVIDSTKVLSDSLSRLDRLDRFAFEVEEAGQLRGNVEFENTYSAILYIYDVENRLVAVSETGSGSASLATELDAGEYVALVAKGYGRYQLDLTFQENTPTVADPVTTPSGRPSSPAVSNPDPNSTPTLPNEPVELQDVAWYGSNYDWNVNSVKAPEAWSAGYSGKDVVVAVIDTGVNVHHSDLNSNIWRNSQEIAGDGLDNDGNGFVDDVYGWNFVENSANVLDDNGHGTHVAGTIAAERNGFGATGIAPDAEVMAIKALNSSGSGYFSAIANGIRYAVDNGASIVNLSLGGSYSSSIASAIGYALANDVLVIAASGNNGAAVPGYPAALSTNYSNLLSVGAYDSSGTRASFSNQVGNSGAIQVDAPGSGIYSTSRSGGYQWLSGTSMAAPHVAGVAALTLSANPGLTASSLRNVIVSSANRFAENSDSEGAVNAAFAIPWSTTVATASEISSITMPDSQYSSSSIASSLALSYSSDATATSHHVAMMNPDTTYRSGAGRQNNSAVQVPEILDGTDSASKLTATAQSIDERTEQTDRAFAERSMQFDRQDLAVLDGDIFDVDILGWAIDSVPGGLATA